MRFFMSANLLIAKNAVAWMNIKTQKPEETCPIGKW